MSLKNSFYVAEMKAEMTITGNWLGYERRARRSTGRKVQGPSVLERFKGKCVANNLFFDELTKTTYSSACEARTDGGWLCHQHQPTLKKLSFFELKEINWADFGHPDFLRRMREEVAQAVADGVFRPSRYRLKPGGSDKDNLIAQTEVAVIEDDDDEYYGEEAASYLAALGRS